MYHKSILNIFEMKYFKHIKGIIPIQSGQICAAPGFNDTFEIKNDARILYFSSGNCIIKYNGKSYPVHKNDVFFMFSGIKYTVNSDNDTIADIWWIDLQGTGTENLLSQMDKNIKNPIISGITNPSLFIEIKSIITYYNQLIISDAFNLMGSLYKICAILLDECTTSEWQAVNFDHPDIIYNGPWLTWPVAGAFNQQLIYTSSPRAFAEFNFYGSGIKWFGTLNFDCGKADIIIDQLYHTTIDCYSPIRLTKQLLYSNTHLPKGPHIIKIFCNGQKNDHSTNCDIAVNEFQYISASGGVLPKKQADSNICKRATEIINTSYNSSISVERIAQILGVNQTYLSSKFKSEIGITISKYIINARITIAKQLLLDTDMSVHEISQSVGYSDAFYFSRIFKNRETISPSDYRNINKI